MSAARGTLDRFDVRGQAVARLSTLTTGYEVWWMRSAATPH